VDYVTAGYSFAFGGWRSTRCRSGCEGEALTDTNPTSRGRAAQVKSSSRRRTIGVLVVLALAILLCSARLAALAQLLRHRRPGLRQSRQDRHDHDCLEGVVKPHTITRTARGARFGSPDRALTRSTSSVVDHRRNCFNPTSRRRRRHFTTSHSTTFDGTQILVKHTATYIAQHPKRVKAA